MTTSHNQWKGIVPKPYCIAPWKAISVNSLGDVLPDGVFLKRLGNLHDQTLKEIWEGELWQKLRESHIEFTNHEGCTNCIKKEQQAGHSRRKFFESFFTTKVDPNSLEEFYYTNADNTLNLNNPIQRPKVLDFENPDFIYLDINTSNKCNLKCIHCNGNVSTAWIPDEKKIKKLYPDIHRRDKEYKNYHYIDTDIIDKLFEDKSFFKNLQFVAFRGGEPFYEKINIYVLEKLIEFGWHKQITLDISTNATVIDQKFFDLLCQFKKVILYISVEGVGPMYQYCRGGENYTQESLDDMIEYFTSFKHIEVCVAYTTMANNIFNIRDTWEWFQQYKTKATITFTNSVARPSYLSLDVLSKEMKQLAYDMLEDIDDEMPWPFEDNDYLYSAGIFKFRKNLKNVINNSVDDDTDQKELFKKFKEYVEALDKIRDTNFLEIEPIFRKYWNE